MPIVLTCGEFWIIPTSRSFKGRQVTMSAYELLLDRNRQSPKCRFLAGCGPQQVQKLEPIRNCFAGAWTAVHAYFGFFCRVYVGWAASLRVVSLTSPPDVWQRSRTAELLLISCFNSSACRLPQNATTCLCPRGWVDRNKRRTQIP